MGGVEEEDQEGAAAAVIGCGRCCEPSGSNWSPAHLCLDHACSSGTTVNYIRSWPYNIRLQRCPP